MILLVGAGGQLGQELRAAARAQETPLTALTRAELDITDAAAVAAVLEACKPRLVVNAAAYAAVDRAQNEPEVAMRANALGPRVLARLTAARGLPLIHFSTDYVFDGSQIAGYREEDPTNPLNVYGRSKLAGEDAVREENPRHFIARISWLYSVYGQNFLKTMVNLARARDEIAVVADQLGSPTSGRSLANAILRLIPALLREDENPRAEIWGLYHMSGAGVVSWAGFAEAIVEAAALRLGRKPKIVPIATKDYPTLAPRPANSVLDNKKFLDTFKRPTPFWGADVQATVDEFLRQGA